MLRGSAAGAAPAPTSLNWLLSASDGAKTRVQFSESRKRKRYCCYSSIFKGFFEPKTVKHSGLKQQPKKLVLESNFSIKRLASG